MNQFKLSIHLGVGLLFVLAALFYVIKWNASENNEFFYHMSISFLVGILYLGTVACYQWNHSVFDNPKSVKIEDLTKAYHESDFVWLFCDKQNMEVRDFVGHNDETVHVLCIWPTRKTIEAFCGGNQDKSHSIFHMRRIEFLIRIKMIFAEHREELYVSLYSYPDSGPLYMFKTSEIGYRFAYDFFGKNTADHYLRCAEIIATGHIDDCGYAECIEQSEIKPTFWRKLPFYN